MRIWVLGKVTLGEIMIDRDNAVGFAVLIGILTIIVGAVIAIVVSVIE